MTNKMAFQAIGDGLTILTGKVRLSYPFLAEPRGFNGQVPKFQGSLVIPKTEDIAVLKLAMRKAAEAKFGARMPANLRSPIRDGSEKSRTDEHGAMTYESGYGPDVWFINTTAKADSRPQLRDNLNREITANDEIKRVFYGGCFVRAIIRAFAYDTNGNKGVSFGLNGVQFVGHGPRFGGGVDAGSVFTEVEVDAASPFDGPGTGAPAETDDIFA